MTVADTQARKFCVASPEDCANSGNWPGAQWVATLDDSAEVRFPDGSVASCLNGGPWLPVALDASSEDADAASASLSA